MFLKTKFFRAITFNNPVKLPLSYWLLVLMRFVLTLLPQIGYIHPDEFFQNVEVIAGDTFSTDVSRTWEFNPTFPVRNIFVPKLIIGPPLHLIRYFHPLAKSYFDIDLKTPYFLLVLPRIFICLLSFINDYCLFKICVIYGQNFRNRLKIFASSYVILVYSCRSFSNSFEMIFFSILLYIVADCMSKSDKVIYHDEFLREKYEKASTPVEKVKLFKLQMLLPEHSLNRVIVISTLVVIGIFNRPTFVGFAFPPLFFWLQRGLGSKVIGFKDFHFRIFTLIFCGIPAVFVLVLVDSIYYGYLTMADIESRSLTWENWVVTPLNFLRYNSNMKNLTKHGLHPRWLHLVVNVPLLFNVLGGVAFINLFTYSYRFIRGHYSKLPRIQSITGLMLFSLVIPVAVLSIFPHQEARFIIPVLVPLVFLYGNHFHSNESDGPKSRKTKKVFLYLWYMLNILLTIFFGFVHQGGMYQFAKNLHYEIKSSYGQRTLVITTHSYSIPKFLLQLDSTSKIWTDRNTGQKYMLEPTTFIRKYGSMPTKDLFHAIDHGLTESEMLLHTRNKKYRLYVVSPCALHEQIQNMARNYHYFDLVEDISYYPHFCSEALPEFPTKNEKQCVESYSHLMNRNESQVIDLSVIERISCFFKRFCLRVYRVKSTKNI